MQVRRGRKSVGWKCKGERDEGVIELKVFIREGEVRRKMLEKVLKINTEKVKIEEEKEKKRKR